MVANIDTAFKQWSTRPSEERYKDLESMRFALQQRSEESRSIGPIDISQMVVESVKDQLFLGYESESWKNGNCVELNNWTFGQLAQSVGAPASYLRSLPGHLVADCINEGISEYPDRERAIYASVDGDSITARAINSPQYSRYHDFQVITDLTDTLALDGWKVPPCRPYPNCPESDTWLATRDDVLPGDTFALSIREGDKVGPGGLYSSDRDSFIFMVNQNNTVNTPSGPMFRALIVSNSEVGAASFKIDCFLYSAVCGNHILWGAEEIASVRVVHRGRENNARINSQAAIHASIRSAELSASTHTERAIEKAADTLISFDDIVKQTGLSKTLVKVGQHLEQQNPQDHGNRAGTVWGAVQGLTRASQHNNYQSERTTIDQAASKLLKPFKGELA
jgi:hypothetical protein